MPTVLAHFFAKSITPLLLALPSKSGKKKHPKPNSDLKQSKVLFNSK